MKQFFRIRAILLLGLILTTFFASCEKPTIDEIITDQSTNQKPDTANGFHKEKIAFDRIKTNKKLQTLFDIQESNLKSDKDAGVYYDVDQDFGVDLTKATYMSRGEYHSYTFPVFRKYAEAKTENLLISLQRDWSYKAFLIRYDFNQEELEKVIVGEVFYGIENKLSVREIPLDGKLLLNQLQAKNEDGPWCKEIIISQATGWPVEINVKCEDTAGGGNNDDSNNEDDWGSDDSNNDDDWGGNPFDNDNGNNNDNGNDGQSGGGSNTGDNTNADEPCIDCLGDYSSFIFEGTLNRLQNMLGYPHYTTEGKWIQNIHNFSVTSKIVNILHNYQNSNESIGLSKKIVQLAVSNVYLNSQNKELAEKITKLVLNNDISKETIDFGITASDLLRNGNQKQKQFIIAVLDDDIPSALNIAIEGATYEQCCVNDPDDISTKMAYFTASIAINFYDGMFNLVKMVEDLFHSDEKEGKFVRIIAENSGVDVPTSISDETLGRLFKVRYHHQGEMQVVPEGAWYQAYLDAAITFVDVFGVLAPSSNGGAFLAIKGGGTITAKALSDYLKVLAKGSWKTVNESMSENSRLYQEFITGKSIDESFEMILPNGNPIKFDGIRDGVLAEAKADFRNFIQSNGDFEPWFTGRQSLIDQGINHAIISKIEDIPIIWYFQHQEVLDAVKKLHLSEGIEGLIYKYLPN